MVLYLINNSFAALWQEVSIRMFYKYYARYLDLPEGKLELTKYGFYKLMKFLLIGLIKLIRLRKKTTQQNLLLWYHLFACESHNNAIATALGVLGKEIKDTRTVESSLLVDKMIPGLRYKK